MRKSLLTLTTLALLALSSCSKNGSSGASNANVMFVNACANGSKPLSLEAKANNAGISGAGDIGLLKNSGYQAIASGNNVDLSFWIKGGPKVISRSLNLVSNTHYSLFVYGTVSAPKIVFTPDVLFKPAPGRAKVRFANFCIGDPTVSCYFGSTLITSGLSESGINYSYNVGSVYTPVNAVTQFFEITPGTAKLMVKDPANPAVSAFIDNQVFSADNIYTVMLTDTSTTNGLSGFYLTVITNF